MWLNVYFSSKNCKHPNWKMSPSLSQQTSLKIEVPSIPLLFENFVGVSRRPLPPPPSPSRQRRKGAADREVLHTMILQCTLWVPLKWFWFWFLMIHLPTWCTNSLMEIVFIVYITFTIIFGHCLLDIVDIVCRPGSCL